MTNVERTNIEECLRNISNLVEFKKVLETSLSLATYELNCQVENLGIEENGIEAIDIPDDSDYQSPFRFKDLMTNTIENILDCWN